MRTIAILVLLGGALLWGLGVATGVAAPPSVPTDPARSQATGSGRDPARPQTVPLRSVRDEAGARAVSNVRTVAAGDGAPLAGATVCYAAPGEGPDDTMRAAPGFDPWTWLRSHGRQVVTDDAGAAFVPVNEGGTRVCAFWRDRIGHGVVPEGGEGVVEIVLRVDRTLRVSTVDDAGGVVAGVTIATSAGESRDVVLGRTDEHGRYVRRHCQELAVDGAPRQLLAFAPGWRSRPVAVDLADPPPEVVLQVPATGRVTVRVVDSAGAPVEPAPSQTTRVHLNWYGERPRENDASGALRAVHQVGGDLPLGPGGVVTFEHVGLDGFVVASIDHGPRLTAPGPTRARRDVELVLQEAVADVVVAATLRDMSGAALRGAAVSVKCESRKGGGFASVVCDGAGRLRYNAGPVAAGRCTLTFSVAAHAEDGALSRRLDLELSPGVNELGAVHLAGDAVLASGRLACRGGLDVARVPMRIGVERDGRWLMGRSGLHVTWPRAGVFVVHGPDERYGRLRIEVGPGPYLPVAPIELAARSADVVVELRPAGEVLASFVVEDPSWLDKLLIDCRRSDADPPAPGAARVEPAADRATASRRWGSLQPGDYTLTVRVPGAAAPIVRIDGIAVGVGRCDDPRLRAIDLRDRWSVAAVEVRSVDGSLLTGDRVYAVVSTQPGALRAYRVRAGRVSLPVVHEMSAEVVAPGLRVVRARLVPGPQVVSLERPSPCRVEVRGPDGAAAAGASRIRFEPELGDQRHDVVRVDGGGLIPRSSLYHEVVELDGGVGTLRPRRPGTYRVRVEFEADEGGDGGTDDVVPALVVLPATSISLALRDG